MSHEDLTYWLKDELLENNFLLCHDNKNIRDGLIDLVNALEEGLVIPKSNTQDEKDFDDWNCEICGQQCWNDHWTGNAYE